MSIILQSQPSIEQIQEDGNEDVLDISRRVSDFRGASPTQSETDALRLQHTSSLYLMDSEEDRIPVPVLSFPTPVDNFKPQPTSVDRESPRMPSANPWLDHPSPRLSEIALNRRIKPKLRYNVSLREVPVHRVHEPSMSMLDDIQFGDDELVAAGRNVAVQKMKIERVEQDLQLLRSSNEQKTQHLEFLAKEVKQLFKRLQKKNKDNELFEQKNYIIRSAVLTARLEKDIRMEIKANKEKWRNIFHDKQVEPDFENHKWIWSKEPVDLIKRNQFHNSTEDYYTSFRKTKGPYRRKKPQMSKTRYNRQTNMNKRRVNRVGASGKKGIWK